MTVGPKSFAGTSIKGFSGFLSRHRLLKQFAVWFSTLHMMAWSLAPAYANDIATDGRTRTSVQVNGRQTDITTQTVHGNNAYNSFKRFSVGQGKTVNLHVPNQADNLINLVRDKRTDIHGTLNGVKGGRIGGNIYLLNPNGIVVGTSGVVNAGSLSLQTPTSDFVDSVLDRSGNPNAGAVGQILNGTAPAAPGAMIDIRGQINTLDGIHMLGGGVNVSGALRAGAQGVAAMRAQVNLGGLRPAANTVHRDRSGSIVIGSPGNVRVSGRIDARGSAGVKGGKIEIRPGGDVDVVSGAILTAAGDGAGSDGGDVIVFAGGSARLEKGALIDASAGESGDGGFVEFSARDAIDLAGGRIIADATNGVGGSIYIDPKTVTYSADTELKANELTVEATERIEILAGKTVSTKQAGDNVVFRAPSIILNTGATLTTGSGGTFGDITLETKVREEPGGDLTIPQTAEIKLDGATIEGKSITLAAIANHTLTSGDVQATSLVDLNNATITGDSVTITATATAVTDLASKLAVDGGAGVLTSAADVKSLGDSDADNAGARIANQLIKALPVKFLVGQADARAEIKVRGTTAITSRTGDTKLRAAARTQVGPDNAPAITPGGSPLLAGVLPGVNFFGMRGAPLATIDIGSNASITSGKAIKLETHTQNSLQTRQIATTGSALNIGALVGFGETTNRVNVASGAGIAFSGTATDDQDLSLQATNVSAYEINLAVNEASGGGSAALAATVLDVREDVTAVLGTTVTGGDDISVVANSDVQEFVANAATATGFDVAEFRAQAVANAADDAELQEALFGGAQNVMAKVVGSKLGGVIQLPFQLAGATSILTGDFDTHASITANQGTAAAKRGDLTVDTDSRVAGLQNLAIAGAGGNASAAVALAVPYTQVDIDTTALVAPGVSLVSASNVIVDANTNVEHVIDLGDLNLTFGDFGLRNVLLSTGGFATASSDAKGASLALAANVNIFDLDTETTARIGGTATDAAATSVTAKDVKVASTSNVESINASGNIGDFFSFGRAIGAKNDPSNIIQSPNGLGGSTGVGATYAGIVYDLDTVAEIGNNVTVTAVDGVSVTADAEALLVNVGASGAFSADGGGDVTVIGVVTLSDFDSRTLARIGAASSVIASGTDADIVVDANDKIKNWNFSGSLVSAQNVGVGAAVGVNLVKLDTQAVISSASAISAGRTVKVEAVSEGDTVAMALSGGLGADKPAAEGDGDGDSGSGDTPKPRSPAAAATATAAVAGSRLDDEISKQQNPTADGAVASVEQNTGDGDANAEASAGSAPNPAATGFGAAAAGAAVANTPGSTPKESPPNPIAASIKGATESLGITVAGDASVNMIDTVTKAEVDSVATLTAKNLDIDAKSKLGAVAASGSFVFQNFGGTPKAATIGIAGSYSHNSFEQNKIIARANSLTSATLSGNLSIDAANEQSIIAGAASGQAQNKPQGASASIAGAVVYNTFNKSETTAELAGSSVTATGEIALKAQDKSTIHSGAGAASIALGSKGLGVGVAGAANISAADVKARIVSTTVVAASSVKAEALAERSIVSVAISAAIQSGSGGATASGSLVYNALGGSVLAEISGGSITSSGGVTVKASEKSNIVTVSGDVSVGGAGGIGIAVAAASMVGNATARITNAATINAQSLDVVAVTDRTSIAVAAGASVSKNGVALKGSVAINLSGNDDDTDGREGTIAEVTGGTKVTLTGGTAGSNDLNVSAAERTNLQSYAGGFAGGEIGVGASVAVNKANGEVTASLANAQVLAADDVSVRAVSGANDVTDTASRTQLIGVAAQVSGSKNAALSGAAVVNKLDTRTTARVDSDSRIGTSAKRVDSVTVKAADRSVAGSGVAGIAVAVGGVSAALAIDLLDKRTTASLAGKTYVTNDVIVDARSSQAAYGGLVAFATSLSVAAAIANQTNITLAEIADSAVVDANNNVHVNAEDKSDVIRFTTATGLASVQTQTSTTTARIGTGADVTGRAGGSADMSVRTGRLSGGVSPSDTDSTSGSASTAGGSAGTLNDNVGGTIATNAQTAESENSGAENVDATAVLGAQTAATESAKGVAVTAHSDQRLINLGLGVGVGQSFGGAATVSDVSGTTTAEIARNAKVNQAAGTAGASQDVTVRAKTNGLTVDTAVGLAGGQSIGVGAGVDVVLLDKSTTAKVGRGAKVSAARDIRIEADNKDMVVSVTTSVAASSGAGLSGAVGVATLSNKAEAIVEAGTQASDAAALRAGRDLDLSARNRVDTFHIVGSVGLGGGTAGAGIGVSVVNSEAETIAKVGDYAKVDAGRKVSLGADADTRMLSVTIAAGIGGKASIAGGISVKSLKSTTLAEIGQHAQVNQKVKQAKEAVVAAEKAAADAQAAYDSAVAAKTILQSQLDNGDPNVSQGDVDNAQAAIDTALAAKNAADAEVTTAKASAGSYTGPEIKVIANDDTQMLSVVGAASGAGLASGAAGIDIITMRGSSTARIANNATVFAGSDVTVDAQLKKSLDGYQVAASIGGGVGVAGSVAVIKAGGALTMAQRGAMTEKDGSESAASQVSALTDGSTSAVNGAGFGEASGASTATSRAGSAQTRGDASGDVTAADSVLSASNDAVAEIGDNAVVEAGSDVAVTARNVTEVDLLTGGIGVSAGVGVGASLALVDINTLATARIGAGAQVTAGGNVDVTATDGDAAVRSDVTVFGGALAKDFAITGAIADVDFNTTTTARIANGAVITLTPDSDTTDDTETGKLTVAASEQNSVDARAYGATAGGLGSVGAQIASVEKSGSVTAEVIAATSKAGGARLAAGAIDISARHGGAVTGTVVGATVGGAGAVGYIDFSVADKVNAKTRIGDYAQLSARDRILIETVSAPRVAAKGYAGAVAGGVAVGITQVKAIADTDAIVETGNNVSFASDGSVALLAKTSKPSEGEQVEARTEAGSGALGVGVTALSSETDFTARTEANIGADNDFQVGKAGDAKQGSLEIAANSDVASDADAFGVSVGGIAAVGIVGSKSKVTNTTKTTIGSGTGGRIEGDLKITSTAREDLDAKTQGGAGGLIVGASAKAENVLNSTTETTFSDNSAKDGFTSGDMTVAARHADGRVRATTDARAGYLVGKTGAYANNTANATVATDIGDKVALNSSGDIVIEAANLMTKSEDGDTPSAYAASGGVAGGAAAKSDTQLSSKVDVAIGAAEIRVLDNDDITNTKDIKIRAYSNTVAADKARLDTGGAIAVAKAESRIKSGSATNRDRTRVSIGDNAVVWSGDGDVEVGARTDANINTSANAKTYGLAGAAEGTSESRIFVDNSVTIGSGARLYAEESLAVRSGADDRAAGSISTIARTRLWNRTAIPIETDPNADAQSDVSARITTASGSRLNAVRNIELTTDTNGVSADGYGRGQDLYQEVLEELGKFLSLFGAAVTLETTGGTSTTDTVSEIVLNNTEVKAGFKHEQILVIAKNPVTITSPDPNLKDADGNVLTGRNYVPDTDTNGVLLQSEGITYTIRNDVSLGDEIRLAIAEIDAELAAFSGDTKTKTALQLQRQILVDRFNELGGKDRLVDKIIVADVTARTGDVSIRTDAMNTTGGTLIEAPGDSNIKIENKSAAFLEVNDLIVPEEKGGRVFFNGALVDSVDKLGDVNARGSTAGITVLSSANTTPEIIVKNTYGAKAGETTPADLFVRGFAYNPRGTITMSTEGNLDVAGEVRGATINLSAGKDFTNNFTYGFFHVGGTPRAQFSSFADPLEAIDYGGLASFEITKGISDSFVEELTRTSGSIVAEGNVYISAETVNVNGLIQSGIAKYSASVDSGTQSQLDQYDEAYAYYKANASNLKERKCVGFVCADSYVFKMTEYQLAGKAAAAQYLKRLIDTGGTETTVEIVEGKNILPGTKSTGEINEQIAHAERQIGIDYNVETRQLEVDNVRAGGGRVQIFGDVVSTGGGQINALHGYAKVDISNDTDRQLTTNAVDTGGTIRTTETGDTASGRDGRIRFINVVEIGVVDESGNAVNVNGEAKTFEATRIQDYVFDGTNIVHRTNLTAGTKAVQKADGSISVAYSVDASGNPTAVANAQFANSRKGTLELTEQDGKSYTWVTGQGQTSNKVSIYRKVQGQAFGLSLGALGDALAKDENLVSGPNYTRAGDPVPIVVEVDSDGDGIKDRVAEVEYGSGDTDGKYSFEYERNVTSSETTYASSSWCSKSGWIFGCFERTAETRQTVKEGASLYYRHSVPVDQPIGIGFIGYDSGAVNIDSKGTVALNDSVSNVSGTTRIVSRQGDIVQANAQAFTTAKVLQLTADTGRIRGATADASVNIDLVNVAGASVSAIAASGIALAEQRGQLVIGNIDAGGGNVALTASTGIEQLSGTLVVGRNVTMTAEAGGIGSAATAVRIDTNANEGRLNAKAAGGINITETSGDLRVERVEAAGDVKLTVAGGSLRDANANDTLDTATAAELLAIWNDNALLAGAGADASIAATTAAMTNKAKSDYEFYWQERAKADGDISGHIASLKSEDAAKGELFEALHGEFGSQTEQNSAYAPTHVVVERYRDSDGGVVAAGTPGATRSYEVVAISKSTEGSTWTQEELSTSVSRNLISARGNTSPINEEANVVGNSITLDVASGEVGATKGTIVLSKNADNELEATLNGTKLDDDEIKLALATAERDDLVFDADGNLSGIEQREDIDIELNGGNLTVAAQKHIFIGSEDSDINIARATSEQLDIRIKAGAGIADASADGQAALSARNAILEAANGSIGTKAKPLSAELNGRLTARANKGDVYLRDIQGSLDIDFVLANGTAWLKAQNGIGDVRNDGDRNILAGAVTLLAGTSIGAADNALDIQLSSDDGVVDATASNGSIWLSATDLDLRVGKAEASASVNLTAMKGEIVNGTSTATAGAVSLTARDGISLGTISAGTTISAQATNGGISQTDGATANASGKVALTATNDIVIASIASQSTADDAVAITSTSGGIKDGGDTNVDITAANGGARLSAVTGIGDGNALETELAKLDAANSASGGIEVSETDALAVTALALGGSDVDIAAGGDLSVNPALDVPGALRLSSSGGTVSAKKDLTADTITATAAGDATFKGMVDARGGDVTVTSGANLDLQANVEAFGNITLQSAVGTKAKSIGADGGKVQVTAGSSLDVDGAVSGQTGVTTTSGDKTTLAGSVTSTAGGVTIAAGPSDGTAKTGATVDIDGTVRGLGGAVTVTAGEDIDLDGALQARDEVTLTAARDVELTQTGADPVVQSTSDRVSVTASSGSLTQTGDVEAADGIAVTTGAGATIVGRIKSTLGAVALQIGQALGLDGSVWGEKTVEIASGGPATVAGSVTSNSGGVDIDTGGALTVKASVLTTDGTGAAIPGAITGKTGVTTTSGTSTDVDGTVASGSGAVAMTAGSSLDVDGSISGQTGVTTTSGTSTDVDGTVTSGSGAVAMTAGSSLDVDGSVSGQTGVTTTSGTSTDVDGTVTSAAGAVAMTAGTSLDVNGAVSGQTGVTTNSGDSTTVIGNVDSAAGAVAMTAGTSLDVDGAVSGQTGVVTTSGTSTDVDGTVTSSGAKVAMTAGHGLTVDGSVSGRSGVAIASGTEVPAGHNGTVNLSATLNGPVTSTDGGVRITAGVPAADLTGTTLPGTFPTATENASVRLNGAVQGLGGKVAVMAAEDVDINADVTGRDRVALTATRDVLVGNAAQGADPAAPVSVASTTADVIVKAGRDYKQVGAVTGVTGPVGGSGTAPAVSIETGADAGVDGTVTGGSGVKIASGAATTVAGRVESANATVTVEAGTSLAVGGSVETKDAGGNAIAGNLSGETGVTTTSGSSTDVDGTVTSGSGAVAMTAGSSLDVDGAVSGEAGVTTTSGTSTDVDGTVTSGSGAVAMTAGSSLDVDGAVTGQTGVTTTSGDKTTLAGSVTSTAGGVTIAAGPPDGTAKTGATVDIDGTVRGLGGAVTVTAGEDIDLDGALQARDAATLTAARDVELTQTGADPVVQSTSDRVSVTASSGGLTQTGDVEAADDITVTTGAGATIVGRIKSTLGAVALQIGQALGLDGSVWGEKTVEIASGGPATVAGSVTSNSGGVDIDTGALTVKASVLTTDGTGAAIPGAITGETGVTTASGTSTDVDGTVTSAAGAVAMMAGSSLDVDGSISGQTGVTTTSGTSTDVDGTVTSGSGAVAMTAGSSLDVDGSVSGQTGVTTTSGTSTDVDGTVTSAAGAVAMTAGTSLDVNGAVSGQTGVTTNSGDSTTVIGNVDSAAGAVAMTAGTSLDVDGAVSGQTGVVTTSGTSTDVDGTVTSSGAKVAMTAGHGLTVDGSVSGRSGVAIASGTEVPAGHNGTVNLSATLNGPVTSTDGGVRITAGVPAADLTGTTLPGTFPTATENASVRLNGAVQGLGGKVAVMAAEDVDINADVTGRDRVALTATRDVLVGNAAQGADPAAPVSVASTTADVIVKAGRDYKQVGAVTGVTGPVGGSGTAPAVSIETGADAGVDGTVTGGSGVKIASGAATTVAGRVESANATVTVEAGTSLAVGGSVETKDAGGNAIAGNLSGETGVTTTSGSSTDVDGTVTSGSGAVAMTAGSSLDVDGAVSGEAGVTTTSGTSTDVDGTVTSGSGAVAMTAGSSLDVDGAVSGEAGVTTTSGTSTDVDGTVTSGSGAVAMTAGSSLDVDGAVSGQTGVTTTSGDKTTLAGSVTSTAGGVTIAAGPSDGTAKSGATVDIDGTVRGLGGAVTVTAGEDIDLDGALQARDAVTLTAARDVELTQTGADPVVQSTSDRVSVTASSGGLTQTGDVEAADGITVTTGAGATIVGRIKSTLGAVALQIGQALGLDGSVWGEKQVEIASGGPATVAGSVTSNSGGVDIDTGGALTVKASVLTTDGTGAAIPGAITGQTGVTTNSGESTTVIGNVDSAAGAVAMTAGTDIGLTGDLTAQKAIGLNAGSDIGVVGNARSNAAGIRVNAGGSYAHTGDLTAFAGIRIDTGGDAAITGDATAFENFTADTGNDFALTGTLRAFAAKIVAGNDARLKVTPAVTQSDFELRAERSIGVDGTVRSVGGAIHMVAGDDVAVAGRLVGGDPTAKGVGGGAGRGQILVRAGDTLSFSGQANTSSRPIVMTSGGDADIDGKLASRGGEIRLTGGDDLTLSPRTVLSSLDGTITLRANGGAGNASGRLVQRKGSGRIDARDGALVLRAGDILLENPLIFGSINLRSEGRVEFAELRVANNLDLKARELVIGNVIHTGTTPLEVQATGPGGSMADLVSMNIVSGPGVIFGVLSTEVAMINADTDRLEFQSAMIGRRGEFWNNRFKTLVDNTTTAIQPSGVQLHQVKAGEPFYLVLDKKTFSTDVDTLFIDREAALRVNLPGQTLVIMSDDVTTHNGVSFDENLQPIENLSVGFPEGADIPLPGTFVTYGNGSLAGSNGNAAAGIGAGVNPCARSSFVNTGGLESCG